MAETFIKEEPVAIDYAELYRQNYQDALDVIRDLKLQIHDLKIENNILRSQIEKTLKYETHYFEK